MPEVKDRSGLVKQFDKAGIKMELADRPLMGMGGRNGEAFQLDISRPGEKNGPREIFRVWPGHAENRVEVLGVDSKLQQGVLMVKEPKRFLEMRGGHNDGFIFMRDEWVRAVGAFLERTAKR